MRVRFNNRPDSRWCKYCNVMIPNNRRHDYTLKHLKNLYQARLDFDCSLISLDDSGQTRLFYPNQWTTKEKEGSSS